MPQPRTGKLIRKTGGPVERETLVALGGNLTFGDEGPQARLAAAIAAIAARIGPVAAQSRIWRTPAFPAGSGPDYANAALRLRTALPPAEILAALHAIEADFGRIRMQRWGARSLDLDLIADGAAVLPDAATQARWRTLPPEEQMRAAPDELVLPHPRLQDRAFVLVPLAEVAPLWRHPLTGASVAEMLAALPAAEIAAVVPWDGGA